MASRRSTVILYYQGCEWDDAFPSRQQALALELANHADVVFLTGGRPRARLRVTEERPAPHVTVVGGLARNLAALERRGLGVLASVHGRLATAKLRRYERVVFLNAENWARPYRFIPHHHLVFDCMDPCFTGDPADFERRDQEVLARADAVFATSEALAEHCRKAHADVTLLNNACHPADADRGGGTTPGWWPARGPVAAYLGSLDWRFDFIAARAAADRNPGVSFVFAGRVLGEFNAEARGLGALPNVTLPGVVSVGDGHFLVRHADLCLVPFRQDPVSDAINPVKLYTYALRGKPIVGTAIRELRSRPEVALAADGPDAFAAAVAEGLRLAAIPGTATRQREFALANTWHHRGETAWARIERL